jgi:hypothetical protein
MSAGRDSVVSSAFEQVGSRVRSPASMLTPPMLARIARFGGRAYAHT